MKKCRNVGHPDHVFAHFLARKIPFGFVVNFGFFVASLCRIFVFILPLKSLSLVPHFPLCVEEVKLETALA